MRTLARLALGSLVAATACGPGPSPTIKVTLSSIEFATTGGNVFNCTTPDKPAHPHSVGDWAIGCNPAVDANGAFSTTPFTFLTEVSCEDGHGAVVQVSCAGDGNGGVSGSVQLALTSSCGAKSIPSTAGQTLQFSALADGGTQSGMLFDCAAFTNLCPVTDACAFNKFGASVDVVRNAPQK